VHHVGILYDQIMMHGQRNIKVKKMFHALYKSCYLIEFFELFNFKLITPCQITRVCVSEAGNK